MVLKIVDFNVYNFHYHAKKLCLTIIKVTTIRANNDLKGLLWAQFLHQLFENIFILALFTSYTLIIILFIYIYLHISN